jgi:acetoin utilization deacetylase AcuC-like enzyme
MKQVEPLKLPNALLYRIHSPHYIQRFAQFSAQAGQGQRIDEDTVVSTGSYPAAQKAAGAAVGMVDALLNRQCDTAFALVRPPGHHAMPHYLMGFCFFNNVALAALHALEQHQLTRVAIIDWDAHHGNGAEAIFYNDPRVFTISWHQDPNWPGTGHMDEVGAGPGKGFNLNIPLPKGSGRNAFLETLKTLVSPVLKDYAPQLILVAAGYDAHHADTMTEMGMQANDFAELTAAILDLSQSVDCPTGFLLEGGYHLEALSNSVTATLMTLVHQETKIFKESFCAPDALSAPDISPLITEIKAQHPYFQKLIQ